MGIWKAKRIKIQLVSSIARRRFIQHDTPKHFETLNELDYNFNKKLAK
jgi:hypothetical protein